MNNGSVITAAGFLSVLAASTWLILCGVNTETHGHGIALPIDVHTSAVFDVNDEKGGESKHLSYLDLGFIVATGNRENDAPAPHVEPVVLDASPRLPTFIVAQTEGEVASQIDVPLPPPRPHLPRVSSSMKRMRDVLALLGRKDDRAHLTMASSYPDTQRTSSDAVRFFRENPPRLIDVFSIPR